MWWGNFSTICNHDLCLKKTPFVSANTKNGPFQVLAQGGPSVGTGSPVARATRIPSVAWRVSLESLIELVQPHQQAPLRLLEQNNRSFHFAAADLIILLWNTNPELHSVKWKAILLHWTHSIMEPCEWPLQQYWWWWWCFPGLNWLNTIMVRY